MNDLINLEVVTPLGMIFQGQAKSVLLPGALGEFGVLKNHVSCISLLQEGVVDIENEKGDHELIAIASGHAQIEGSKVLILVQGAVYIGENKNSELATNLEKVKKMLESISSDTSSLMVAFSKLESSKNQ